MELQKPFDTVHFCITLPANFGKLRAHFRRGYRLMKFTNRAFSRADLLFCVAGITFLFALAASLFAGTKSESQRAVCFNNLRQIGRAFHVWGNDYEEKLPWQTYVSAGGTRHHMLGGNAWWQYSWISNQLGSPRILVCPADGPKRPADNWGTGPGGFLNPAYRNNGLSYSPFLHALANNPASLLAGDRNFGMDQSSTTCPFFVSGGSCFALFAPGIRTWTNAVHGLAGHLLFMEGSVQFTTPTEFQQAISRSEEGDTGVVHGLAVF
jgi:hypothetical protein